MATKKIDQDQELMSILALSEAALEEAGSSTDEFSITVKRQLRIDREPGHYVVTVTCLTRGEPTPFVVEQHMWARGPTPLVEKFGTMRDCVIGRKLFLRDNPL